MVSCAPLLADIFLYSYEADFIQSLLSTGKKKLSSQFNFTYRYIDDVLSMNNPDFEIYLCQMYKMYPAELQIKDTTESNTSASYLDLLLSIQSDGQMRTSLYHRSITLLWYNQCNGRYDQFVTAGTISFNGGFALEKKKGIMDGMKIWIFLFVCIMFSNKM